MKKLKPGLSVVVPALNEEKYIKNTINKISSSLKASKLNYEIFIVDDGSVDSTYQEAIRMKSNNKKITVLRNKKNYGMGFSLKVSSLKANYNKILLIPGDDSFSKNAIKNLAINSNKADFIIGYRVNYFEIVSLFRKITFLGMKILAFILTGKILKEVNGSIIYPTKIIKSYNLKSHRYNFSIDLLNLMFLYKLKYKIVKVYINKKTIYNTNAGTFKNIFSILKTWTRLLFFNILVKIDFIKLNKFNQNK